MLLRDFKYSTVRCRFLGLEAGMFRTRDFIMMDVSDVKGKRIGFIKDILINFSEGVVTGFLISPYNLFVRSTYVVSQDIVSFGRTMIIKTTTNETQLKLRNFIGMEVIDARGNILGIFEDIIFSYDYRVKGLVISSGFINKLLKGKRIVLISEILVGDDSIIYMGNSQKVSMVSMPHRLIGVE
jgi:uncharacterized protein YrrD